MSQLITWLNRPYPLLESRKNKLALVVAFGLFVYVFLMVFKPFRAIEIGANQVWFLAGFGVSVSLGLTFCYFFVPFLFKKWFVAEHWQIKKEILFLMFAFLVVAILNFTYNSTIGHNIDAPQYNFLNYLGITFSIGLFPTVILVFLVEIFLKQKNNTQAQVLSERIPKQEIPSAMPQNRISIQAETSKYAVLKIAPNDFLLAISDNNYVTIFYYENGAVQRQLLRLSMKKLQEQLSDYEYIIRCHRSYMVNKKRIKKIEGNARSLILRLENYDNAVPVSRSFPREGLF